MVSLIAELEARETAARVRVEELEAEIAELTSRLMGEREAWSRLRGGARDGDRGACRAGRA